MIWPFKKRQAAHKKGLSQPDDRGRWITIFDSFPGAWQQDIEVDRDQILAYHAIFACITLIASDIAKLRVKLVQEKNGICTEIPNKDYAVIGKPNTLQNRIQFYENWISSKLSAGNTYILKQRNSKLKVTGGYVLSPRLVTPLVSESGEVFYRLSPDNIAGLEDQVVVPASEIIHDRFNCLFHPLVGLSPLFASGLAAMQGLSIQKNSTKFFGNMSRPSGILTGPDTINKTDATEIKARWEENYGGDNVGKVAVLGNNLKFEDISVAPAEAQMVEQLRMTAEIVCSTFHVPKYKVAGDPPSFNNIEVLEQGYYNQCLQRLIEDIELCWEEGLEMPEGTYAEFDLEGLLRMDSSAQMKMLKEAVGGTIYTPNEARKKANQPPVPGGDALYMQQQNYSLEALAKRDASDDPFAKSGTADASAAPKPVPADEAPAEDQAAAAAHYFRKRLERPAA